MIKPSVLAKTAAKKRAKARGRSSTPINIMDVLKSLDEISRRLDKLEAEVKSKRDY